MQTYTKRDTISYTQTDNVDHGQLQVNVLSEVTHTPITDATVTISYKGEDGSPLEQVSTDISGQTATLDLPAPPLEYSMEPGENQPYSQYTLEISAPGYDTMTIAGTEILPDVKALQEADLHPTGDPAPPEDHIVIPDHTLYAEYPPKIPEDEVKPVNESGEIVLDRVVVPEYVIVHDGSPNNSTARDYYIHYADYIKT